MDGVDGAAGEKGEAGGSMDGGEGRAGEAKFDRGKWRWRTWKRCGQVTGAGGV